jgi:peptide/nickel transport system substrate-binding protein
VGAGPYRFVSFNPGIELVVEAYEGFWRKTPAVKRLVFKSVPDERRGLAMLKRGEADIAYSIRGANAEEVKRTSGAHAQADVADLHRVDRVHSTVRPEIAVGGSARAAGGQSRDRSQGDQRGRIPRLRQARLLDHPQGFRVPLGSAAASVRPREGQALLAEAGYPKGFDAFDMATDAVYAPEAEAVINGFQAIGIRSRLQPLERAAFYKADQEKSFKHLVRVGSAAAGNAATRIEAFVISTGIRAYGGYPDIDSLFRDQAAEMDKKRRETMLQKIQQLMHERSMFARSSSRRC